MVNHNNDDSNSISVQKNSELTFSFQIQHNITFFLKGN